MTTSGRAAGADPATVAAWIAGWALSRGLGPPVAVPGGHRVDVGWADQRARYVYPRLDDAVVERAVSIHEPLVFLKVCAEREAVAAALPPPWEVVRLGWMMTLDADRARSEPRPLPDGYALELTATDAGLAAHVRVGDEPAANGQIAVVGDAAIYDRIVTEPAHRRRGLGSAVMRALEAEAVRRGAARGILVATDQGRALYESLGWRLHSPYATAVIPGDGGG